MAQAILVQARKRKNMVCEPEASVGDLVYIDALSPNKVIVAPDNKTVRPIIGLIISKPTPTKAIVLINGIIKVGTIINPGQLFVSTDGGFTLSVPTQDYTQILGISFGDGYIDFSPERRIKRS